MTTHPDFKDYCKKQAVKDAAFDLFDILDIKPTPENKKFLNEVLENILYRVENNIVD